MSIEIEVNGVTITDVRTLTIDGKQIHPAPTNQEPRITSHTIKGTVTYTASLEGVSEMSKQTFEQKHKLRIDIKHWHKLNAFANSIGLYLTTWPNDNGRFHVMNSRCEYFKLEKLISLYNRGINSPYINELTGVKRQLTRVGYKGAEVKIKGQRIKKPLYRVCNRQPDLCEGIPC